MSVQTIDIYDYIFELPNFFDLDTLGDNSDLVNNLNKNYFNCLTYYNENNFEEVIKSLNVNCTIISDFTTRSAVGLLFPTEQDKLAFILKVS